MSANNVNPPNDSATFDEKHNDVPDSTNTESEKTQQQPFEEQSTTWDDEKFEEVSDTESVESEGEGEHTEQRSPPHHHHRHHRHHHRHPGHHHFPHRPPPMSFGSGREGFFYPPFGGRGFYPGSDGHFHFPPHYFAGGRDGYFSAPPESFDGQRGFFGSPFNGRDRRGPCDPSSCGEDRSGPCGPPPCNVNRETAWGPTTRGGDRNGPHGFQGSRPFQRFGGENGGDFPTPFGGRSLGRSGCCSRGGDRSSFSPCSPFCHRRGFRSPRRRFFAAFVMLSSLIMVCFYFGRYYESNLVN